MNDPARLRYESEHRAFLNLVIHVATVPLFFIASAAMLVAPFTEAWAAWWGAGVGVAAYCALLQRFGHRLESVQAPPAGSVGQALRRFLQEQFVTFPRFVVDGGFLSSFRRAARTLRLR